MHRRIRRALCSLKEHTSVSCAKIATIGGFCDLDLVFIKATSPDDLPFDEKYVHEIVKIFEVSPASFREFALFFARRFNKTQCWKVALKSLLLLHRLLRSLPENSSFRTELSWAISNRYITLYPCEFQDYSSSSAEDYTTLIRSYARLLDEAIDCPSIEGFESDEDIIHEGFPARMKQLGRMIEALPKLQSVIDRVMDCRPTGAAERNYIVQSTMKHIIRDSFACYMTIRKEIVVILDNLIQLPHRECSAAFDIYKKAAIQANEVCSFYSWSKSLGLCGAYEYPFVERIPLIQIRALGVFLSGMWQLTESSSSPSPTMSNLASNLQSPSTVSDEENDKLIKLDVVPAARNGQVRCNGSYIKQEMQKDAGMEPLIQLEADINSSWEALLEASLPLHSPCIVPRNNFLPFPNGTEYRNRYGNASSNNFLTSRQMQVYNTAYTVQSATNPFHYPDYMPIYH